MNATASTTKNCETNRYWDHVKMLLQERWPELTDDDLEQTAGDYDDLITLIQTKCQMNRVLAEQYVCRLAETVNSAHSGTLQKFVHPLAAKAAERFQQARQETYAQLQDGYRQTQETIQRHPVESLALSFATGLIAGVTLGLVLRSR